MCGSRSTAIAASLVLMSLVDTAIADAVPPPAAAPTPVTITVPAALAKLNETIEPSGVVWAAPLQRYLVVSDDTGEGDARHAPWLMAMSREGAFDAAPVPIVGVGPVNDAESICAGPGGTFFLVTSHSLNKKGHLKPERRMLLQLRLDGRTLRAIGRVDLTTARDPAGRSLLQIAALPADGRLDIEAITVRDGALLIGLKSPLSTSGGAVVLRLADPAKVIAAGRIPPAGVTRQWEVPLRVEVEGRGVSEGIADMTVLPDGSMILLGNAPKGMPADGGGAMYHYRPGAPSPELMRRFPGLKPEGVTLADDGASLVLVFDNDSRPPLWLRLPLPPPLAVPR